MNILITGAWTEAEKYIPQITARGHRVLFLQQENDELPCAPGWVEGVICNSLFCCHPIEEFSSLKFIQLTSAGYDRVPMAQIVQRGIEIHNAGGVYSIPMAEFAVAGVLWLFKRGRYFEENRVGHRWQKRRDIRELNGCTVVIAGCGSVGTECAARFAAFGCHITGIDELTTPKEPYERILPPSRLDEAVQAADVLVITLPLTEKTRGLIDKRRLGLMKPDSVLVNISRGAVVDEKALENYARQIGGAVLDVFEEEPLAPESPLWDLDNVIITPHNSFVGTGNGERLRNLIFRNMEKYL